MYYIHILPVQHIDQILSVLILLEHFNLFQQFFFADPAVQISNLFQTGDLTVLMLLECLYKVRSICQTFVRAGIQPGKACPSSSTLSSPFSR